MDPGIDTTEQQTLTAAGVLASARAARSRADAFEAQILADAVTWAHLHPAGGDQVATYRSGRGEDTGITLAGLGAPAVSDFCISESATALGLSEPSGRALLGQALELAHRLPRLWARVRGGDLPAWRARRIAETTLVLTPEAAAWVDAQVAPFAHKIGPAATERLVEAAIARFMPEYAVEQRDRAAETRHLDIDHHQVSFHGTSEVRGTLDLADALDLDLAVSSEAAALKKLGSTDTLDARRAAALGAIARRDLTLDYHHRGTDSADAGEDDGGKAGPYGATSSIRTPVPATGSRGRVGRVVHLYVHLSEAALRSHGGHGYLENAGPNLVTAGQLRSWCATPGTRVTIRPVIDLDTRDHADSYAIPDRLREHVTLRDRTCVFPWCTRPARGCDLDHVVPYEAGGPTATDNLAPLCRKHHRLKTHGGWTYFMRRPGSYQWTSPFGYTYRRDHSGTTDLTPPSAPGPRVPHRADTAPGDPPEH